MPSLTLAAAAIALLAATSAPAEEPIGKRTAAPDQAFSGIGEGVSDAALAQDVAAAAAHPLGSAGNPIRVGGPEGAQAYLARLRCGDGNRPKIGPRTTGGIGAFGTIVELYPLDCGAAAPGRATLAVDFYHEEHREDRAPAGFAIERR
jgi:hypothetical protein